MINSAHVFTPRPSTDPRENLRVLQSPLKTPFPSVSSEPPASWSSSAIAAPAAAEEEEEDIILVESNCPRVVEEEKDLVILDEVILPPQAPPSPSVFRPIPVQNQAPPRTPVKRARPSLHRAVLLRSAQKVAMRAEIQREEQMEVEEVEDSIVGMDEDGDEDMGFDEEVEDEDEAENAEERRSMSPWRLGIEAVKEGLGWAFRGSSVEVRASSRSLHYIVR